MKNLSAIFAAGAYASVVAAVVQKRYVRDPSQTVTGNELAYNITSPKSTGGKAWTEAHAQVLTLLGQMTLTEKVSYQSNHAAWLPE
jgi:hypothetical protein